MLSIRKSIAIAVIASAAAVVALPQSEPTPTNVLNLAEPCGHRIDNYIMGCKKEFVCDYPEYPSTGKSDKRNQKKVCIRHIKKEGAECNGVNICINGLKCVEGKCIVAFPANK
ncbi:hypothetical protein SYNPS1DRAFT_28182 [Syncephalis pseudoplumigaleata]|uniref:Uncharacterized protein n=1 Tax=Syncephalis pseudoplumigaleata TaxID=1712513 RepID=A0A4P9Z0X5_9FUNG|nr:hypothetical protein SYNPS1DRAFT_28182 [Syncephalis pseudoplumigaleata]|eukprot:RKP26107.1 hypothetical protein SYNPS1DRAFT_28182 [Syncephalis pseudoplumigaleata]